MDDSAVTAGAESAAKVVPSAQQQQGKGKVSTTKKTSLPPHGARCRWEKVCAETLLKILQSLPPPESLNSRSEYDNDDLFTRLYQQVAEDFHLPVQAILSYAPRKLAILKHLEDLVTQSAYNKMMTFQSRSDNPTFTTPGNGRNLENATIAFTTAGQTPAASRVITPSNETGHKVAASASSSAGNNIFVSPSSEKKDVKPPPKILPAKEAHTNDTSVSPNDEAVTTASGHKIFLLPEVPVASLKDKEISAAVEAIGKGLAAREVPGVTGINAEDSGEKAGSKTARTVLQGTEPKGPTTAHGSGDCFQQNSADASDAMEITASSEKEPVVESDNVEMTESPEKDLEPDVEMAAPPTEKEQNIIASSKKRPANIAPSTDGAPQKKAKVLGSEVEEESADIAELSPRLNTDCRHKFFKAVESKLEGMKQVMSEPEWAKVKKTSVGNMLIVRPESSYSKEQKDVSWIWLEKNFPTEWETSCKRKATESQWWTLAEYADLYNAVQEYKETGHRTDWAQISRTVLNRARGNCYSQWMNTIQPAINRSRERTWSPDEDKILLDLPSDFSFGASKSKKNFYLLPGVQTTCVRGRTILLHAKAREPKTNAAVMSLNKNLQSVQPARKKRVDWTLLEDAILYDEVQRQKSLGSNNIDWITASVKNLGSRSNSQCGSHWATALEPAIQAAKEQSWTSKHDAILAKAPPNDPFRMSRLYDIPLKAQKGRAVILLSQKMESKKTETDKTVQNTSKADAGVEGCQPHVQDASTIAKSDPSDSFANKQIVPQHSMKALKESADSKSMSKEDFMDLQLGHSASQLESPTSKTDTKESATPVRNDSPTSKDTGGVSREEVCDATDGTSFSKSSTDDDKKCLDQVQDKTDGDSRSKDTTEEKKIVEEVQDKIDVSLYSKDTTCDNMSVEEVQDKIDEASSSNDAENETGEVPCTKGTVDGKQSGEETQNAPDDASRGGLDTVDEKKSHGEWQNEIGAGPRESPTYTAGTFPSTKPSAASDTSLVPTGINRIDEAETAEDGNCNDPSGVIDISDDEYGDIII